MKLHILDLSPPELEKELQKWNIERYRSKQILHWIFKKNVCSFLEMSNMPKNLKELLQEKYREDDVQSILKRLNPRARKILSMRFGINHDHAYTFEEIGDVCNLTRERIRQIVKQSLDQLRAGISQKDIDALML